jgi:hypothetical protein
MARRIVNIGQQGNDGTGDSIREAFRKVNDNFQDLFAIFGSGDTIKFTDLSDTPSIYESGQIFYADSTSSISAKTLTAGDGITIGVTGTTLTISSDAATSSDLFSAPVNARGFVLGNIPQPDTNNVQDAVDLWNQTYELSGISITIDDLLISKRYADGRYQLKDGTSPIFIRDEPLSTAGYVKNIASYTAGDVIIAGHGYTPNDNGKAFYFRTTGTIPTWAVPYDINNPSKTPFYIKYVNSNTLSFHTSQAGAIAGTSKINAVAAPVGAGVDSISDALYDPTLSGLWLTNEAIPRNSITRRQGDTMTGFLTLHADPTVDLHAATKQYVDNAITGAANSDFITEGTTNLYYTTARATIDSRLAMSVTDLGGDGSLSYNNATGVFTYTGPSATEVRAHFSAGTGVSISAGQISIGQDVGATASPTFATVNANLSGNVTGNLTGTVLTAAQTNITSLGTLTSLSVSGNTTISGDLTVSGTTTTVNSTVVTIDDPVLTLGGDTAPLNDDGKDRGIEFRWHNGVTSKLGFFGFDRNIGKFTFIPDATNVNETFAGAVGTIVANLEGAVTGNVTGNVTGTVTGQVSSISNHTTDALSEGTTNLYYTTARATNDARVAVSVTDSGGDGSLSYNNATGVFTYTGPSATEVRAHFSASTATGITYNAGEFSLSSIPNSSLTNSSITINGTSVALGGTRTLNTDDISESATPTNKWYTDSRVYTKTKAIIQAGANVSLTYNDTNNTITITSGAGTSGYDLSANTTDDLSEGGTNLYFTEDRVHTSISINNTPFAARNLGLLEYLNDGVINLIAPTAAQLLAYFASGDDITFGLSVDNNSIEVGLGENVYVLTDDLETSIVPEPATATGSPTPENRLYFTNARARSSVSATTSSGISYNSSTGVFSLSSIPNSSLTNNSITINGTSVALGGTRTLNTDDISESGSPTNLWHTTERAQDAAAGLFSAGTHSGLTFTYNDASNNISASINAGTDLTVNGSNQLVVSSSTTSVASTLAKRTTTGGLSGMFIFPTPVEYPILSATSTLAVATLNSNIVLLNTTSTGRKLRLPAPSSFVGYWLLLKNVNDTTNTIDVEYPTGNTISTLAAQGGFSQFISDGEDWLVI